jgi:hypothetical protein
MSAPKCRVCGEAHWSSEPHKFKEVVPTKEQREEFGKQTNLELLSRIKVLEAENGLLKQKLANLEGPKVDRKTYMREYMRKKRGSRPRP